MVWPRAAEVKSEVSDIRDRWRKAEWSGYPCATNRDGDLELERLLD